MKIEEPEIYFVQNPALGATLLAHFIQGYYEQKEAPVSFPLLFYVLPIIFCSEICNALKSTQKNSGLTKFIGKMEAKKDILYLVNSRGILLRQLTFDSIKIALSSRLCHLDVETGYMSPHPINMKNIPTQGITKIMCDQSKKFGYMCSNIPIHQLCALLKVRL